MYLAFSGKQYKMRGFWWVWDDYMVNYSRNAWTAHDCPIHRQLWMQFAVPVAGSKAGKHQESFPALIGNLQAVRPIGRLYCRPCRQESIARSRSFDSFVSKDWKYDNQNAVKQRVPKRIKKAS